MDATFLFVIVICLVLVGGVLYTAIAMKKMMDEDIKNMRKKD